MGRSRKMGVGVHVANVSRWGVLRRKVIRKNDTRLDNIMVHLDRLEIDSQELESSTHHKQTLLSGISHMKTDIETYLSRLELDSHDEGDHVVVEPNAQVHRSVAAQIRVMGRHSH